MSAIFEDNGILIDCPDCQDLAEPDVDCEKCEGVGDLQGKHRRWRVDLNIGIVHRLKTELEWDIQEDARENLQTLFDPDQIEKQVDILWLCVEAQAERRGVTEEEFANRLGGDAITKAHNALIEEVKNFFRVRGLAPLATAVEKQAAKLEETMERMDAKVAAQVDSMSADLDARLDADWEKAMKDVSGLQSGISQVSSE